MFGGNDWFAEEESEEKHVYSGEFTSITIHSYFHSIITVPVQNCDLINELPIIFSTDKE